MQDDNARVRQALKAFERELIKLKKLLASNQEFSASLESLYSQAALLEEITASNPATTNYLSQLVKQGSSMPLFKEVQGMLSELKRQMQQKEDANLKAEMFFENFRSYRTYKFKDLAEVEGFLSQTFSLYGINFVYFKPEFVGTIDLGALEKELGLQKQSSQTIRVPVESLAALLNYLKKRNIVKRSRLDSELIRLSLHGEQEVFVESENDKIKRLDRLCKQLGGSYLEN